MVNFQHNKSVKYVRVLFILLGLVLNGFKSFHTPTHGMSSSAERFRLSASITPDMVWFHGSFAREIKSILDENVIQANQKYIPRKHLASQYVRSVQNFCQAVGLSLELFVPGELPRSKHSIEAVIVVLTGRFPVSKEHWTKMNRDFNDMYCQQKAPGEETTWLDNIEIPIWSKLQFPK